MLYKTEMHLHTSPVSHCGIAAPNFIVEKYSEAGYSTLVLTNHMSKFTYMSCIEIPWEDKVKFFLGGYHSLKNAAGNKLNILLGMELRLDSDSNDYLVYGFTEDFMLDSGCGDFTKMRLSAFTKVAKKYGCMIFQAHPFRNTMNIINPAKVDGIEVFNGNAAIDSRNDIAAAWAEKYSLRTISGSDYHKAEHSITGGIATQDPIRNNEDLVSALKAGEYSLIKS